MSTKRKQSILVLSFVAIGVALFFAPKVKSSDVPDTKHLEEEKKIAQAVEIVEKGENPMAGIMMLREVLENNPESTSALFELGVLSIKSGQYDKAIGRFQSIIAIDSTISNAYYYLAHSYAGNMNKEKAIETFEKFKKKADDKALIEEVDNYILKIKNS